MPDKTLPFLVKKGLNQNNFFLRLFIIHKEFHLVLQNEQKLTALL